MLNVKNSWICIFLKYSLWVIFECNSLYKGDSPKRICLTKRRLTRHLGEMGVLDPGDRGEGVEGGQGNLGTQ